MGAATLPSTPWTRGSIPPASTLQGGDLPRTFASRGSAAHSAPARNVSVPWAPGGLRGAGRAPLLREGAPGSLRVVRHTAKAADPGRQLAHPPLDLGVVGGEQDAILHDEVPVDDDGADVGRLDRTPQVRHGTSLSSSRSTITTSARLPGSSEPTRGQRRELLEELDRPKPRCAAQPGRRFAAPPGSARSCGRAGGGLRLVARASR